MPAEHYLINTGQLLRAFRKTAGDKDFRIVEEDGHILQWQFIGSEDWKDVLDLTCLATLKCVVENDEYRCNLCGMEGDFATVDKHFYGIDRCNGAMLKKEIKHVK